MLAYSMAEFENKILTSSCHVIHLLYFALCFITNLVKFEYIAYNYKIVLKILTTISHTHSHFQKSSSNEFKYYALFFGSE